MRIPRFALSSAAVPLVLVFLAAFLAGGPSRTDAQPIEREQTVYFSNIAPGELESDLIRNLPAKIMMQSESGKMYGGAFVRIFNASGIAIFKRMCEKPWLFLKLPEGDYNVVAVDRHQITRVKPFHIAKQPQEGVKRTVVKLVWPKKVVGY
jgi:hypothetical protein